MYIYTESGGNSSGNERKISYFPGSIKKKKRRRKKGRKDTEVLQFQMQFLGRPPSTGHSTYRTLETTRRHRKTVCADSWPDSLPRIPYCFALPGLNGLENGADINDPTWNSASATVRTDREEKNGVALKIMKREKKGRFLIGWKRLTRDSIQFTFEFHFRY